MRTSVLLALVAAWSAACADAPRRLREATYGPSFHYITREEIVDTMTALAYWIDELNELMWDDEEVDARDQERIVEILTEMDRLAQNLKLRQRSNHPRIDRSAPWLQGDIRRALRAARATPPNYYYAGLVPGACEYCHPPRHGSAERQPPDPGLPD